MTVQWIPGHDYFANSYVCGSVLVDAGVLPMAVEPYREQIESVVLTHSHFDHIAHLKEIAHMCNAEICIHRDDAGGLSDNARNLSLMFGEHFTPVAPDRILNEGDVVGGLRVFHTPGHTPGGIALYDEGSKILFSGDTVFTDGGFGRCDFPGGSMAALRQSVERLAALDVDELYPGHGTPARSDGGRHISAALRVLMCSYV